MVKMGVGDEDVRNVVGAEVYRGEQEETASKACRRR
jgi:hypothetical protein